MFRIGIIGTENSHAKKFATLFRDETEFADMKIVAVGGHYPESNEKICEEFGIDHVATSPEDMLGKVDAVIITARDGIYHADFARPFIEEGIPMFMDKPFTVDPMEAVDLVREAKKRGVPMVGGSTLKCSYETMMLADYAHRKRADVKGGTVAAPIMMDSPYSGFFFYASHLTETSLKIFGYDPKSVTAFRKGNDVTAYVEYDRYAVTNNFNDNCMSYFGQVFTKDGIYSRNIEYSLASKVMATDFANMLRYKIMPESYEELIYPVFYMNAVKKSYETGGKTVEIEKIEL